MAVVAAFDEDALVVEPHELTPEDRREISQAIAEIRKRHDTEEVEREALDLLKARTAHGPDPLPDTSRPA